MELKYPKNGKVTKKKIKILTRQKTKSLILKAMHDVWSLTVRFHDNNQCQWCGSFNNPQAHHIVARGRLKGKVFGCFDIRNGMCLCYHCHMHRLKRETDEYNEIRDNYLHGKGLNYKLMVKMYSITTKYTNKDLLLIYRHKLCSYLLIQDISFQENIDKITKRWLSKIEL